MEPSPKLIFWRNFLLQSFASVLYTRSRPSDFYNCKFVSSVKIILIHFNKHYLLQTTTEQFWRERRLYIYYVVKIAGNMCFCFQNFPEILLLFSVSTLTLIAFLNEKLQMQRFAQRRNLKIIFCHFIVMNLSLSFYFYNLIWPFDDTRKERYIFLCCI